MAAASRSANARPRTRTKKPRPCFDDGALTRIFKFPCKTYPRSSYYVTSEEIIIRIKKARKRWKLVVPKKRIVSYRTNRWFAKPRWVEIELTFTQASRLGLVAARPAAKDDKAAPGAPLTAADADAAAPLLATEGPVTLPAEAEQDAYGQTVLKLGPEPDEDSETAEAAEAGDATETAQEAERFEAAVAADEAETATAAETIEEAAEAAAVIETAERATAAEAAAAAAEVATPEPMPLVRPIVARARLPLPPAAPAAPIEIAPPRVASVPAIAGAHARPGTPRRSHRVPMMLATLALVMAGTAGGLLALREPTEEELAAAPPCPLTGPEALHCAQPLATGSIDRGLRVHDVAPEAPAPLPSQEPAEPAAVADAAPPEVVAPPPPPTEAATENAGGGDAPREEPAPVAHTIEPESPPPAPVAVTPARPIDPMHEIVADAAQCSELRVAAESIEIRFEYASAALERATLAMLRDFASLMQACHTATVVIEGHTDSDGHTDRNHALSLRRADAVREQLMSAGARPERITVVAYGDTRPFAPNVSAENKRRNRRAAMVVQGP